METLNDSDGIWDLVEPRPAGLCGTCGGSGSIWKTHPGGEADLRWYNPMGPCPKCDGRGGWVWRAHNG